jgi:LPPG:FO 2-phospho-L-lactate transferase
MDHLGSLGVDTSFRLGDRDLSVCLLRSQYLSSGGTLSGATASIRAGLGVDTNVLPATDDTIRTRVRTTEGSWLSFQEYFVGRGHRDEVAEIEYAGAEHAEPAPGVIEAIEAASIVVIAPSNPPLSIRPILEIRAIEDALAAHPKVVAISPFFGGKALKGPADRVMASLGYAGGNAGVAAAYDGIITDLVIDTQDAADTDRLSGALTVHVTDTYLTSHNASQRFGRWFERTFT